MLERPPLLAGEDGGVDLLGVLLLAQDHSRPRPPEGLVGGGGDHVGPRLDRTRVQPRGDESGEVGHVDHQQGPHLIGDLPEAEEVELAGVGGPARQDQLGLALPGDPGDLIHVDQAALPVHLIGGHLIETSRDVEFHAMRQVTTVGEGEAHDGVPWLQQGVIDGGVGLGAGVGLDVGVLGPEEGLGAVDGELLGDVHPLAAPVVAPAGVALGVLVGQHRPLALEDGPGDEVLRGDHLQGALLTLELPTQDLGDLRVHLGQRTVEVVGTQLRHGALLGRR